MPTIGVQMMMLRDEVGKAGPYEVLRRLTDAGFRAVEVSQIPMTPENVAEMRRARDELGVDFGALSAAVGPGPNDCLVERFDKIVADCRALDARHVRIGMMPLSALATTEGVVEFCRRTQDIATRLADEGVQLHYHNHHVEFARRGGVTVLDAIRAEAPGMRLEIDVHWVQRGGRDPVRTLQKYAGLVDLVHLKDYRIGELGPGALEAQRSGDREAFLREFAAVVEFGEVGEGNLEWAEIVDQSIASGAEYLLIEQDVLYGRDAFDCLATSREHLVDLGYEKLL
ncbi:sugar phosphate isomerase/epimerase [Pseudonocardia sp. ICBG1293]|uniref:sugar phosphate isomerase/epimerase family protein n=1 Tax=Pseudonocardia sp. ICBG1293 TaxID=2844382 RepID=UPI001CCDBC48|nr:TIM barrel protein [Pseudonocardia sp. ICBG1293]